MRIHLWIALVAVGLIAIAGPAMADGGTDHQAIQARPILLGTSGGNINDISKLYCCSGTLGGLVQDGLGVQYILSNNHVLGGSNKAAVGDPVNQPGMIDQNCQADGVVAHFSALVPIQFSKGRSIKWNEVDAAMAEVVSGEVSTTGAVLDIGGLSGNTLTAIPGMGVQKSGRTTGHTTGTVLAIDVTSAVGYSDECGGAAKHTAYFENQIRIGAADFSAGGDSGSIVVEYGGVDPVDGLPRAVGLLFAGDSTSTLANPIAAVLEGLGVTMVPGIPVPEGPTGTVAGLVTDAETGEGIAGARVSLLEVESVLVSEDPPVWSSVLVERYATYTGDDGTYSVAAGVGTYSVNASAIGYEDETANGVDVTEDTTSTVDLALSPLPFATNVLPGCVTYNTSGGRNKDKDLLMSVKVVNDFGEPVAGAAVDISVTLDGAAYGTGAGATTDASGVVSYQARNAPNGTYVTTVTNIQADGLTFSGSSTTPENSFQKGTDSVPADFCQDSVSPSSGSSARTLSLARAANARSSAALMALSGVVGHGVGVGSDGGAVIEVYVLGTAGQAARGGIPAVVEGVPVRIVETDGFLAY